MKIHEFKKFGVSENLLNIYVNKGYIVINNDNASIISDEFAIRLFLSVLGDNYLFAKKIARDVCLKFSSFYLGMLISLYDGDFDQARVNIDKMKKNELFSDRKDEILLYDFILNNNDYEFKLPYEDNEYLKSIILLVKKYIKLRQFKIASDILSIVLEKEKSNILIILSKTLENVLSQTKYLVDDNYQVNDKVTYEGLASLERRLIVSYEMGDYITLEKTASILANIMHDDLFIRNIIKLIELLNKLKSDDTCILKHSVNESYGYSDRDIEKGINTYELYGVYESILNLISNSQRLFSIKTHMYKIILDDIMDANKRNLKHVVASGIGFEEAGDLLDKYTELVDARKTIDAQALLDKNNSCLNNYDYLIKEVDTLAANKDEQIRINDLCDYADSVNDPYVTINNYQVALQLQTKKDPIFYIKIAAAYEELGNYAEALHILEDAEAIYAIPDTYLKMMELFIRCSRFDKVLEYHRKYETYYPEVNSYDYYLVSIAYMNLGRYEEAMNALDISETINQEINNIMQTYDKEKNILRSLIKKESVSYYGIDDFVSFEIDDIDQDIIVMLDEYLRKTGNDIKKFILKNLTQFSNIEDTLMYLLNIVKILILSPEDNRESIDFVDGMIKNYDAQDLVKKKVLEKISIYKSAVKL